MLRYQRFLPLNFNPRSHDAYYGIEYPDGTYFAVSLNVSVLSEERCRHVKVVRLFSVVSLET